MAILVLPLGILPSDLLPHIASLPGSASHPPRARAECGEAAEEPGGSWQWLRLT